MVQLRFHEKWVSSRGLVSLMLLLLLGIVHTSSEVCFGRTCDAWSLLGVTCSFLESEGCNCSSSLCSADTQQYTVAETHAVDCLSEEEDDLSMRPCARLSRDAIGAIVVESRTSFRLDGANYTMSSSKDGSRVATVEAVEAVLELVDISIGGATDTIGGCVFVGAGSSLRATRATFEGCGATYGGAVALWTAASATVFASTFRKCSATHLGGTIYAEDSSVATLSASRVTESWAGTDDGLGGGVYMEERSSVSLVEDSHVARCFSAYGGGIRIQSYSVLLVHASTMADNAAYLGGDVASMSHSEVTLVRTTIRGSVGYTGSGSVHIFGLGTIFSAERVVFADTFSSSYGGGVNVAGTSQVSNEDVQRRSVAVITDCDFVRNTAATGEGGAILINEEIVVIANTTFEDVVGSAIQSDIDGDVEIVDSTIVTSSSLESGGCIRADASRVSLRRVRLENCSAEANGGAVAASSASTIILEDSMLVGNVAAGGYGGGVFLDTVSELSLMSSTIAECAATTSGGGVAAGHGSVVHVTGAGGLKDNTALEGAGGGIYATGGNTRVYVARHCTFVAVTLDFSREGHSPVDNVRVSVLQPSRSATTYFDTRGIATSATPVADSSIDLVLCLEPARYQLWTASVKAEAWGGGSWSLWVPTDAVRNASSFTGDHPTLVHGRLAATFDVVAPREVVADAAAPARFDGNRARSSGGAIAVDDAARLYVAPHVNFEANVAAAGHGGALSIGSLCIAEIDSARFRANAAASHGGGMAALTLSETRVNLSVASENEALGGNGGFAYFDNVESAVLGAVTVRNNTSRRRNGGGVALESCRRNRVVLRGVLLEANVALINGGGASVVGSSVEFVSSVFAQNLAATGSGGGVSATQRPDVTFYTQGQDKCARTAMIIDWTTATASCRTFFALDAVMTCDVLNADVCTRVRMAIGEDVCFGCRCAVTTIASGSENYVALSTTMTTKAEVQVVYGVPAPRAVVMYETCVVGNASLVYSAHNVLCQGWHGGLAHLVLLPSSLRREAAVVPIVDRFSLAKFETSRAFERLGVIDESTTSS